MPKEIEEITARLEELEDLVLTNQLQISQLADWMKEVRERPEVKIPERERLMKDIETLEKWLTKAGKAGKKFESVEKAIEQSKKALKEGKEAKKLAKIIQTKALKKPDKKPKKPKVVKCSECYASNDQDASFCIKCGTEL